MDSALESIARDVCSNVDWTREELDGIAKICGKDEMVEAALALVRHMRERETPRLGYSQEYVQLLRARATRKQRRDARKAIDEALQKALVAGAHSNPITGVGAETLFLGADAEMCGRIAASVVAARDHWDKGTWGTTRGICELLRRLFVLPECPDEAPIPLLGWLQSQIWPEWEWARTWGETMLGSSGHNWWAHTFLGLYEAGLFFPEFKGFSRFRSFAPVYFEHELDMLMESDGFTKERSGYHYGTVQIFLDFLHVAEENGVRLSPAFHERLRRSAEVFWKVLTPSGEVPYLGDSGAHHRPYPEVASQERLRSLAALLDVPEAKYVAETLDPDWQPRHEGMLPGWGRDLLPSYRRVAVAAPPADTTLPASGYYFMRQDWNPRSDYMCIEAGPLGATVHSHDHTAVFGFELYSRGRPILIDNGSGPYGDSPARLWRVGSASHNVATVDGRDHIPMSKRESEWRWDHTVLPFVNAWVSEERYAYFSGAHEGYRHLKERVSACRRKVFYLRGEYWILIDRFKPKTDVEHEYTVHFHVNAPCRLEPGGRAVTEGSGGNLLIVPVEGVRGDAALAGCPHPLPGYDNPYHLTYTRRTTEPSLFVTLLVPFEEGGVPEVSAGLLEVEADERVLTPWEATALGIEINGQRDVYFDQHMQWNLPWKAGDCSGDGRLFHSRCQR